MSKFWKIANSSHQNKPRFSLIVEYITTIIVACCSAYRYSCVAMLVLGGSLPLPNVVAYCYFCPRLCILGIFASFPLCIHFSLIHAQTPPTNLVLVLMVAFTVNLLGSTLMKSSLPLLFRIYLAPLRLQPIINHCFWLLLLVYHSWWRDTDHDWWLCLAVFVS